MTSQQDYIVRYALKRAHRESLEDQAEIFSAAALQITDPHVAERAETIAAKARELRELQQDLLRAFDARGQAELFTSENGG